MGMSTNINGHDVPVNVAFGLCHQVVREYDAGEIRGYAYPRGTTTLGLPWFSDFRKAVEFLEGKPFAGCIQSYVMKEDGTGPSWITAGCYYLKKGGRKDGPISCVVIDMSVWDDGWHRIKPYAARVITMGDQIEAAFEVTRLYREDEATWPAAFRAAVAEADDWCCPTIMVMAGS